jgi:putative transcriptional regulator
MRCRLGEIMKQEGRTGRWLADKTGVNEATISLIKREKSLPSLPVAIRIAKAIGYSVEEIWIE